MVDAALLHHQKILTAPPTGAVVDKWHALRELAQARTHFGLTDRDITVLQALISFHPVTELSDTEPHVVFPSNTAICARLNGMPCSTMRRHLGKLIEAGLIIRRDSPNGKRYRRRGGDAFGFDLAPLVHRFGEIQTKAEQVRLETQHLAELREAISLMRRDLAGLLAIGRQEQPALPLWTIAENFLTELTLQLRRKPTTEGLTEIESHLRHLLGDITKATDSTSTKEMSTIPAENEHHYHKSNKETYDSKPQRPVNAQNKTIALADVLDRCKEISTYAPYPIQNWHDLLEAAEIVRPMMGLAEPVWAAAKRAMGAIEASVVLAAMLQRYEQYRSPGGYLRVLTHKAEAKLFSSATMIRAINAAAA